MDNVIAKVLRWGNSYGIRISAEDARKLFLREGQEVTVEIKSKDGEPVDMSWFKPFRGPGDLSVTHDQEEWA